MMKKCKTIKRIDILLILIFFLMLVWYFLCSRQMIISDGVMYYQYFVDGIIDGHFSTYIKYPVGTALLQLPFLLVGHCIALLNGITDPYSMIYQTTVFLASAVYVLYGTRIIFSIVRWYSTEKSALMTSMIMICGTMALEYATRYASFSHAYGYFLCACFIRYVIFYEQKRKKGHISVFNDIVLGFLLGLILLIRFSNISIVLFYVFFEVDSYKACIARMKTILTKKAFIQVAAFLVCYLVQLLIWKAQTGKWILYSYEGEHFSYLLQPQVGKVLFSDAKGLLVYNPALIFSLLGCIFCRKQLKKTGFSIVLILSLQTYIISAWGCWWLGGGFSERMFADFLPVFAIPMAAFFDLLEAPLNDQRSVTVNETLVKTLLYCAIIVFSVLNLVWIHGEHIGLLNDNLGTWEELLNTIKHVFS